MSNTQLKFPQGIVDNIDLFNSGHVRPGTRGDVTPIRVVNVFINQIDVVGQRKRKLDPEAVEKLYADILHHGIMQPIGVQQKADGRFKIVFGLHRLEAFRLGAKRAAEQYRPAWERIPALIYPTADKLIGELKEIAENLIRNPLNQKEQEEHRVRYAQLLKRDLSIQAAPTGRPKKSSHDETTFENQKPTVYEKMEAKLGVTKATVARDFANVSQRATAVARAEGLPAPKPINPVKSTPDEIEVALALSQRHTEARKDAEREGKDPRRVMPLEPTAATNITVRIDLADPQLLIKWFGERLSADSKPVSKDYIRTLAHGLFRLIGEA